MKKMWSPWRSRHIASTTRQSDEERAELFERIARSDDDEANYVVYRGKTAFVVMNLYPYNNGHLLIVPFRRVEHYDALTDEEQVEIARLTDRCIRWLRRALSPDGFNVGMNLGSAGGAGVPEHLHVHVVPRWNGDTNFMATVSDVKVIPESMDRTYHKLLAAVQEVE
ncbi:MAG: HIT domain-containing protein [Rhodothermales bacterium]